MLSLTQLSVALPRLVYKITSCNKQFQECIFVNGTKLQADNISSSILAIRCPGTVFIRISTPPQISAHLE